MLDTRTLTVDEARIDVLKSAIETVIRERLGEDNVASIIVERKRDYDGDIVFLIDVFLSGQGGKLDAKRASDMIGQLLPTIDEHDEGGFPLINYISQLEASEKRPG